jgi:hypothetical protein
LKVEWSLSLWTKGYIKVEKIRDAEKKATKSRMMKIDFSPKKNSRGSESTFHTAFSAGEWSIKTLQYLISVKKLTSDEMQKVMNLSRDLIKGRNNHRAAELEENDDDPRSNLCGRTFNDSEIESFCSDDDDMMMTSSKPMHRSKSQSGSSNASGSAGSSSKPLKGTSSRV